MEFKKQTNVIIRSQDFSGKRGQKLSLNISILCLMFASLFIAAIGLANENTPHIIITTMNHEKITGKLLYVTDSLLVVWASNAPYKPEQLNDSARTVFANDIEQITIERKGHFWKSAGLGALIGGGTGALMGLASGSDQEEGLFKFSAGQKAMLLGIVLGVPATIVGGIVGAAKDLDDNFYVGGDIKIYKSLVPGLKKIAQFSASPPAELKTLPEKENEIIFQSKKIQVSDTLKRPIPSSFARVHLTFSGMWSFSGVNNNIEQAFNSSGFGGTYSGWFGPINYPTTHGSPITWEIEGAYSLGQHLRVGVELSKIPKREVQGINDLTEVTKGTSYCMTFHYVSDPYNPFSFSRWEYACGIGIIYNSLTIDIHKDYSPAFQLLSTHNKIGLQCNCSFDYYFSRHVSIRLKLNGKVIPKIHVPAIEIADRHKNQTLREHSVNFSMINFSIGLAFHLGSTSEK